MTPREAIIEALHLRRPEGLVPHCELEFQLSQELLGKEATVPMLCPASVACRSSASRSISASV